DRRIRLPQICERHLAARSIDESLELHATAEELALPLAQDLILESRRLLLQPLAVGQRLRHLAVHARARARAELVRVDAEIAPRLQHWRHRAPAADVRRRARTACDRKDLAIS